MTRGVSTRVARARACVRRLVTGTLPAQSRTICNLQNSALKDYYFHFIEDREAMTELLAEKSKALEPPVDVDYQQQQQQPAPHVDEAAEYYE